MQVASFDNQAKFLLENGLVELAREIQNNVLKDQISTSQQINTLTAPQEMGELFKVMILERE